MGSKIFLITMVEDGRGPAFAVTDDGLQLANTYLRPGEDINQILAAPHKMREYSEHFGGKPFEVEHIPHEQVDTHEGLARALQAFDALCRMIFEGVAPTLRHPGRERA